MKNKTKAITGTAIAGAGVIVLPHIVRIYGKTMNKNLSMKQFMKVVNEVYGVNLSGVSSLKYARVSLFAKGHWILHHHTNLFVVHTGDSDIKIYQTDYFTEKTGLTVLPLELQEALIQLGMSYNETESAYYYANPNGKTISDIFIGKALKAVTTVIQNSYAIL